MTFSPPVMDTPRIYPADFMAHQKQTFDFTVDHAYAGIWLGVGGGKTYQTLRALQYLRPARHILVVAPIAIARSTWLDQIQEWKIPIRTRSLLVDEQDRKLSLSDRLQRFQQVFTDPPTMYFINVELLTRPSRKTSLVVPEAHGPAASPEARELLDLARRLGPVTREELTAAYRGLLAGRTGGPAPAKSTVNALASQLLKTGLLTRRAYPCRVCQGKGCQQCRFGLIDQMPIREIDGKKTVIWPFQTVILDESQKFKSHRAACFKAMASVRPAISRLIELTGTPQPNGVHDLWSQIYLLDQGEALGKNITAFRNRWFTAKMTGGVPTKWIPNPGAEEEIYDAIKHLVISAKNTNVNMPPVTIEDVNVTLPADLVAAYKQFKQELVLEIANSAANPGDPDSVMAVIAANQGVLESKLLQFASGTIYTDPQANPGHYEVLHDEKIQMLEYLVGNSVAVERDGVTITSGSPVLVAYHFRSDKEQILARLRRAGYRAEAFDGSREMVRRWNARQIPVMLLHPASAGHGLNLQQGGHTLIWFTLMHNLEHYLQTNGRLHRTGQTEPVTIYRLITKGTQDARMPGVLGLKERNQENLLEAVDADKYELAQLAEELNDELNDLWTEGRL